MDENLNFSGGGDTFNGMEARVAKLEAAFEHIQVDISDIKSDIRGIRADAREDIRGLRSEARADFRLLFGCIITVAIGLAGMMAKGFGWF
ncbi:hypothetical protein [Phyllobacterium leguminum]|uniref:Hemolysin XhlA n=1 Tax=Phyllobacterium leguminum TaxID=314237 RepID=A0A318T2H7_9HYPH|nr:hypothetical protein [Phyllobacterium leguminum]PYE88151.1 hypothetical protein C7477_10822 [Phyllobacterium leguminum]